VKFSFGGVMMKRNPWFVLLFVGFLFAAVISLVVGLSMMANSEGGGALKRTSNSNLLVMEIKGVIFDSEKFLKKLRKYRDEDYVKGILLKITSPGGAVGPAEEIYRALKQFKEETKKPIVVYSPSLNASGGYYISMASDKIFVSNGALIGSIGVIMEFANIEKLYDWAKVQRFSITSGKFKDAGSEYRSMTPEEKSYFQDLIGQTYQQFREAVKEGRKLDDKVLDTYADGRVFNGEQAVKLGFADQIGSQEDAAKALAELAGLGEDYELFETPKRQPSFIERILEGEDPDEESEFSQWGRWAKKASEGPFPKETLEKIVKLKGFNQPMAILPGIWFDEDGQ
jgi:protease-4